MADLPDLTLETIQAILDGDLDDDRVNALVLRSLGFRYDAETGSWEGSQADPQWPTDPLPDVIANRKDSVRLTRSIPPEDKQLLKQQLNFPGYTLDQLTPTKTRRATAANWLLGVLKRQNRSHSSESLI